MTTVVTNANERAKEAGKADTHASTTKRKKPSGRRERLSFRSQQVLLREATIITRSDKIQHNTSTIHKPK